MFHQLAYVCMKIYFICLNKAVFFMLSFDCCFVLHLQIEHVRPHSKYLAEYFLFLLEFAKLGEEECSFLTNINCISTMVHFYMGQKQQENYVSYVSVGFSYLFSLKLSEARFILYSLVTHSLDLLSKAFYV